ncbi:MAG: PAS domain S-box protein [Rhodospirillales bacterium]|nr:PAS domain S-box protein [Rhodospirillales bacterium]
MRLPNRPDSAIADTFDGLKARVAELEAKEAAYRDTSEKFVDLLRNLEVHQEELRIQNEELQAGRTVQEIALAKYTDLFDNSPMAYVVVDSQGVIQEVNHAGAQLLGLERRRLAGKALATYIAPAQRQTFDAHLRELFANQRAKSESVLSRGIEDIPVILESSLLAGSSTGGEPHGLIAAIDISGRKRAEREADIKSRELERSNAELQSFAYVVSHDLQEPLRMIGSYVQLLARRYKGALDSDADEFIHFAVDGVERLSRMINDLLDYSRVETRGRVPEPTDAAQALGDALANLEAATLESGATCTVGSLPWVMADPHQLGRLFQNLIGNALKYRSPKRTPRILIDAVRHGAEWHFSVADNGIGIDPAYFNRLFRLFQRLHTRQEYPGTGVGLAICKKIVERHGGRIWVDSTPDRGSTFYFSLPGVPASPSN